ncbi:CBS domain-containing protein [Aurantiacibacter poecillastricola]|uniref:CBS domain-containing protein n=1 Tax=Aurantiacibacter poecillastricola TaxID=3064385 RepID=UPI00273D4B7A|nr:CBS domain-containing protein [Aurantiacibacter sp. 219JJ12-13]MDP5263239.1 CBS domain-containing protein [Aurantiacibacter sp. 219JJ12-13]
MRIDSIMTTDPVVVNPLTTCEGAARLMRNHEVGALPVVKDGKVRGIVTDRDLVVRGMADGRDGFLSRVADVMTSEVLCCASHHSVKEVLEQMAAHQVRRILVLDADDRLVGILALADISRHPDGDGSHALGGISQRAENEPTVAAA